MGVVLNPQYYQYFVSRHGYHPMFYNRTSISGESICSIRDVRWNMYSKTVIVALRILATQYEDMMVSELLQLI